MVTAQISIGGLYRLKTKEEIDTLCQKSGEEEYIKLKICPSSYDEYRTLASFVKAFLKKFGIGELKFSDPDEWSQYLTIEFAKTSQDKNEILDLINSLGFWACLDGDDGVIDLADVDLNILKLVFPSQSFLFQTKSISQKVFESVTPQHFDLGVKEKLEVVGNKTEKTAGLKIVQVVSDPISKEGDLGKDVVRPTGSVPRVSLEELKNRGEISVPYQHNSTTTKNGASLRSNLPFQSFQSGISNITFSQVLRLSHETVRESFEDAFFREHQRELFRVVKGVEYWNDSRATNVNAVWFTLETIQKPIIWVAGGADKGNDYEPILELVRKKVISLILLGRDTLRTSSVFEGVVPEIIRVASMIQAVQAAHYKAKPGNAVVLSPGCASFDLFESYEDRGRQFKQAVWTL